MKLLSSKYLLAVVANLVLSRVHPDDCDCNAIIRTKGHSDERWRGWGLHRLVAFHKNELNLIFARWIEIQLTFSEGRGRMEW